MAALRASMTSRRESGSRSGRRSTADDRAIFQERVLPGSLTPAEYSRGGYPVTRSWARTGFSYQIVRQPEAIELHFRGRGGEPARIDQTPPVRGRWHRERTIRMGRRCRRPGGLLRGGALALPATRHRGDAGCRRVGSPGRDHRQVRARSRPHRCRASRSRCAGRSSSARPACGSRRRRHSAVVRASPLPPSAPASGSTGPS